MLRRYFKMNGYADKIFAELEKLPAIESCVLGGSRAGQHFDGASDYDVYVYVTEDIPEQVRQEAFGGLCSVIEVGNRFWEYEDNLVLGDGVPMDIIYRRLDDFSREIEGVCGRFEAHNGYTTCMWHNLLNSRIVFDRKGRYEALRKRYDIPYPEQLRENIISRNMRLLSGSMPSYAGQIKKAADRGDINSVCHRVTEFMASYFDVIFALNRKTHPGEKRLVSICLEECSMLPRDFEDDVSRLLGAVSGSPGEAAVIAGNMAEKLAEAVAAAR